MWDVEDEEHEKKGILSTHNNSGFSFQWMDYLKRLYAALYDKSGRWNPCNLWGGGGGQEKKCWKLEGMGIDDPFEEYTGHKLS